MDKQTVKNQTKVRGDINIKRDHIIDKYMNLTEHEFDSVVQVLARIFMSNELCLYVVKVKGYDGGRYIRISDYDKLRQKFNVTKISDKARITRINFKKPEGYAGVSNVMQCNQCLISATMESVVDALRILGNKSIVYSKGAAIETYFTTEKILRAFCMNKYKGDIDRETCNGVDNILKGISEGKNMGKIMREERERVELERIGNARWMEIVDTDLKETVGYALMYGNYSGVNRLTGEIVQSELCVAAQDKEKFGINESNIEVKVEAKAIVKYQPVLKTIARTYTIKYSEEVARNYRCSFIQKENGVETKAFNSQKINKAFGVELVDEKSEKSNEQVRELNNYIAKQQKAGNRWFICNNVGRSTVGKKENTGSIRDLFKGFSKRD